MLLINDAVPITARESQWKAQSFCKPIWCRPPRVIKSIHVLYCFFLTCVLLVVPGSHNRENQCPVNEHGCLDVDVCIHMSKLCDGVPDCSDGWDEGPHCRGNTHAHTQITSSFPLSPLSHGDKSVALLLWVESDQPAPARMKNPNLFVSLSETIISIQ